MCRFRKKLKVYFNIYTITMEGTKHTVKRQKKHTVKRQKKVIDSTCEELEKYREYMHYFMENYNPVSKGNVCDYQTWRDYTYQHLQRVME